ncbi:zeta toxin family protein [Nocardiopsis sp. EMB25]|uniref:zeta toxin family protein n=1 Tax=Nocardiopsis sp. EMB25 TaxID=2835867 RepID=UPI0022853811|nr:zeta toxin family protein [Nocardiopsis sp. EMB25]MCY9785702.1 zeta toxin family protein [Nocardiopsis sp. EMB25]
MPPPYEVRPERLQEIFDEYIKDLVFGDVDPVPPGDKPVVVLLGGQTGAGKSSAFHGIMDRHGGNIAEIKPDEFRLFHPDLDEIMRNDPHAMLEHTAQAMYAWSDMTRNYAHAKGYGLIIENTYSRPEYLLKYAEELSKPVDTTREDGATVQVHRGFEVESVVVATPSDRSCLDLVGRYLSQPPEKARWSDAEFHDFSFDQLPRSVEVLETCADVDRIIVTDRDGVIHYNNERASDGRWEQKPQASQVLQEIRGDGRVPFSHDDARMWLSQYWQYSKHLLNRDELNAVTAPTMLALHERADRVAQVAYAGDADRLAEHEQWQKVQKVVFMAGERGAPNADLPHHPEEFLHADAAEKTQFFTALRDAGKSSPSLPEDAVEAVRRAQQGAAPPTIRTSPSALPTASSEHRQGREKGPDIER